MSSGFTLLELLVVVAIVGILAIVVLAQYEEYRIKAQNSAANVMAKDLFTAASAMVDEVISDNTNTNPRFTSCIGGGIVTKACSDNNYSGDSLDVLIADSYFSDSDFFVSASVSFTPSANTHLVIGSVTPCKGDIVHDYSSSDGHQEFNKADQGATWTMVCG